jgi:hypothetical protein
VLPADNVWNTDISYLPVHARSAAWLNSSGAGSGTLLHPDFGGPPYGIPFNVVNNTHATANFDFQYWQESDPAVATKQPQGPYPYGSDLLVEGPTDSHLLTINSDTCKLYETWATDYNGPRTAGSGAIFDLNSDALRTDGWTSADAAGLPIFPGLVRLDEVQGGAITHAIRFTVQRTDTSHLWPARHDAGSASDPNLPPMGARFRLKSSFDISSFNAPTQVVLTAMKHYGMIVADNGSNWFFQGTMDSGWNNEPYATMISQFKTIPAGAFEAVDESSLMADPNSGRIKSPCTGASVAPGSPTQPAGSTVNLTAGSTGCTTPEYEFWAQYPDTTWHLLQGFGGPALAWNTAGLAPGVYTIHAWVNNQGAGHDAIGSATVTLTGCGGASLSPSSTTQPAGATITLTASSSGCGSPRYAFWVQNPGGSWYFAQNFGGPAFNWNTAGLQPGTYNVHVWVNSQGNGYDAIGSATVTLTGCTAASLSPSSPSQPAGSTFSFTASSTGCLNPRYAFWVQYPNTSWHFVQGFGGPNFNWSTSGLAPGSYTVHAWVNQSGSGYDSVGSATPTLTGCTAATLSPGSGSSPAGSTITFTAGATGCPNPTFELWLLDPGGTWHFMRPYSTNGTWSWNSAGWPRGSYTIHVWANQQGADLSTYEAIGTAGYSLS